MGIGEQVRQAREAQGLGLRELARRAAITPHQLSRLERVGWASREVVEAVAGALRVPLIVHGRQA